MTATGAVTPEPAAQAQLERWYRRLLRAYPTGYRRTYGDDILAMLMDSAEPGRRRPARADVVNLAGGAVRQWFRLPVGPSAIVAAVLAALVLAATGAAAGSWLSWQTAAELPTTAQARQIGTTVAGAGPTWSTVSRSDGRREIWRDVALFDENQLAHWTVAEAQARLRAEGWTPGRVELADGAAYRGDERLASVYQRFDATRDGLIVTTSAMTITTPGLAGTRVFLSIHPAEPPSTPVATALGWLAGALAGWLLTGWAGYRLRRRALPRRLATLTLGLIALGLAAQPTIGLYRTLWGLAFAADDLHQATPAYRWVVETSATALLAGAAAAGLGILILAATARRPIASALNGQVS